MERIEPARALLRTDCLIDVGPCVSQRILEAHGGHLDIKQGRTEISFTLTLPVTQL